MQQRPPTRLETWLDSLPMEHLLWLLVGVALLALVGGALIGVATHRVRSTEAGRATRAVSSNRKAGRVSRVPR